MHSAQLVLALHEPSRPRHDDRVRRRPADGRSNLQPRRDRERRSSRRPGRRDERERRRSRPPLFPADLPLVQRPGRNAPRPRRDHNRRARDPTRYRPHRIPMDRATRRDYVARTRSARTLAKAEHPDDRLRRIRTRHALRVADGDRIRLPSRTAVQRRDGRGVVRYRNAGDGRARRLRAALSRTAPRRARRNRYAGLRYDSDRPLHPRRGPRCTSVDVRSVAGHRARPLPDVRAPDDRLRAPGASPRPRAAADELGRS